MTGGLTDYIQNVLTLGKLAFYVHPCLGMLCESLIPVQKWIFYGDTLVHTPQKLGYLETVVFPSL